MIARERPLETLARWVYAVLLRLLTPLYLLRLWRRGGAEPAYRQRMGERLGFCYERRGEAGRLWIHAVSLGETLAAAALLAALRAQRPGLRLLLTHSTATGLAAGAKLLQAGDAQTWLPYDTPGAVRRFLRHWRPAAGVLMETEIWPVLLHEATRAGLPMVLANARLSAKSERQGRRLAWLLHPAARRLALVLAQTEADAQRLRASGAPRIEVCGNLKFDLQPDAALLARGRAWRTQLARPVLLLAVSREGEEALLLQAWRAVRGADRPLLLIVPRHPQRFDEVAALITGQGLSLARRSAWQDLPPTEAWQADAWLGDSMREMALYYGLADVALLGGSFAPLGGQNLIEAAACGCPLVMGPSTFNFAEAAELAEAAGAARRVVDMPQALVQALHLALLPARRAEASAQAQAFAAQHGGAAARMAAEVLAVMRAR
ncbi:3-deoxy-D-manno-octulosonic acid transferase [Roseateles cavernae]|uniref:3-deoxy-D-manno-octulosonic acid transferase n=1 Tax=Roseateles cavernae TaxID=3153578 RepID=UPI0032E44A05